MTENGDPRIVHTAPSVRLDRIRAAILRALAVTLHTPGNRRIPIRKTRARPGVVRHAKTASIGIAVTVIQRAFALPVTPLDKLMTLADGIAAPRRAIRPHPSYEHGTRGR